MLRIVPVTLDQANAFVWRLHRHKPEKLPGHSFSVGVAAKTRLLDGPEWVLVGVAIVGNPSAPALQDGILAEIRRVCTDGTRNACSMLYGTARRAARAMGRRPVITYTLATESGSSLRAAGFRVDKANAGGPAADGTRWWQQTPGWLALPQSESATSAWSRVAGPARSSHSRALRQTWCGGLRRLGCRCGGRSGKGAGPAQQDVNSPAFSQPCQQPTWLIDGCNVGASMLPSKSHDCELPSTTGRSAIGAMVLHGPGHTNQKRRWPLALVSISNWPGWALLKASAYSASSSMPMIAARPGR